MPLVGATPDANRGRAAGAQRLENGIDAVDKHESFRLGPAPANLSSRPDGSLPTAPRPPDNATAPANRALAREHPSIGRQTGARIELGAAFDRRHEEIELRTFAAAVSATRIGWKSALPFCPVRCRTRSAARAKRLAIEQTRRGREILGQRLNHAARLGRGYLVTNPGTRQRRRGLVLEQQPQTIRHLVEAIDRRAGHRHDAREVPPRASAVTFSSRANPARARYGSASDTRRAESASLR